LIEKILFAAGNPEETEPAVEDLRLRERLA
jgi:hypothetical protein